MRESLKLAVMILFHPIAAFEYMKRKRETLSGLMILAVIFLAAAVQIFSIYVTHYPLSTVNLRNANVVFECAKILLPVVTWGVASYAMTTILDGETKFSEAMLATCYAMIPFLLISPLLTLFSRILDLGQSGLYYGMYGAMLFWIIALLLTALKEMNHYSVGKTAVVTFLSLFTMMLIWASVALLFSLSMQFITFVKEVIVEARYLFS